jgi:hypothetical protein
MTHSQTALLAAHRRRYQALNIPEKFWKEHTAPEELLRLLKEFEPRVAALMCRVVPSSFDPDDPDLTAMPRSMEWQWTSLERFFRLSSARMIMSQIPLYWQVASALERACAAAEAPVFAADACNVAVCAAAVRELNIEVVVSAPEDAAPLIAYLSEKHIEPPRSWFIVHAAKSNWSMPPELAEGYFSVQQEVHLFPGVPLLEQCAELAASGKAHYHTNGQYAWSIADSDTLITSMGDDPLPLINYQLPFSLREAGLCACGKTIVCRA